VELFVPVSIEYVTRTNTQELSMHGVTCCHKCPVTLSPWVLSAGSVPTTGVVSGGGGVATGVGLLALKGVGYKSEVAIIRRGLFLVPTVVSPEVVQNGKVLDRIWLGGYIMVCQYW